MTDSIWEHTTAPTAFGVAVDSAVTAAKVLDGKIGVADLRALMAGTAFLAQELTTDPGPSITTDGKPLAKVLDDPKVPSPMYGAARFALLRTWELLAIAESAREGDPAIPSFLEGTTLNDGDWNPAGGLPGEMKVKGTVAGWPAVVLGGVAIVAEAAVIAYCAYKAGEIVNHWIDVDASTRRVIAAHANVTGLARIRLDAAAAGHDLGPASDAEKAAMGELTDAQKHFNETVRQPSDTNPLWIIAAAIVAALAFWK